MRLTSKELEKVKQKYGVTELWSFSKFDSYRTSQYEWMLKYLKHLPENNEIASAYASLGGAVHDIIENLYDDKISYENMLEEFEDVWLTNIDIAGLVFDRNDTNKNDNIKQKYYTDLQHFFSHYQKLPYKMQNEQFITVKISDDIVMQGYLDACYKDENDVYTIVDYKTSTKYSGKAIAEHSAQLVLYSEALRQLGIPKEKIRCCWNFLKYVNIDCMQINGKIKTRTIERHEIGDKLKNSVKTWLKKLGYEDQMVEYLDALITTNDIKCLPEDVQEKYIIHDCYIYVEDIWDFYENLKEEVIETVTEINEKVEKYKYFIDNDDEGAAEELFWDDEDSLKAQAYYFNNLSGYTIPTLKPYKEYLDKITAEKNGDIFAGGTEKSSKNSKNNIETVKTTSSIDIDELDEDDLSWLDEL